MDGLDPHERPPDSIRNIYKKYQKLKSKALDEDENIVDFEHETQALNGSKVRIVKHLESTHLQACFQKFAGEPFQDFGPRKNMAVYEHADMPGLHMIPSLLPPSLQQLLLSRLLHRDLSNPSHLTNIHTHYAVTYPPSHRSFFSIPPSSQDPVATPLDPTVHKPLTISQLLSRKLRWTTLGGQYDWTEKKYPDAAPPAFPKDVRDLLEGIFTDTAAEAAIVNLYSPGDTLSVHRDVAETSATGLVSVSLGCDAIFVIGSSGDGHADRVLTLRLRSGSAVYMSGASRFAWHGVPQIVPGTCPDYLVDWPGSADGEGDYQDWKGWMANKRVNLNVRQMQDI
ncbi:hypothetical protein ACN47E_009924 [Coniothyrium glycines]